MTGLTIRMMEEAAGGVFHLSFQSRDGRFVTLDRENLSQAGESERAAFDKALDTEITSIVTDSRKASKGAVFGAIVGERVDGHNFIRSVFEQGAACVLSERTLEEKDVFGEDDAASEDGRKSGSFTMSDAPEEGRAWIMVESTIAALGAIAARYLDLIRVPVVGITGSVGKTSTKEMIASVLSVKLRTRKTEGNFNNELGLPLTVFGLEKEDEAAVLEMGVSHFGDMTQLARIARPKRMVITNIGTCHLEFLQDREGVFRAKTEVFDYMGEDSFVFLNGNDDLLRKVSDVHGRKPVFFGVDSRLKGVSELSPGPLVPYPADLPSERCVVVTSVRPLGFEGSECRIQTPRGDFTVKVPVPGIHNCSNAAAATAVALSFGMSLEEIREGIESAQTISGRFRVLKAEDRTVIDDCYNANPVSMKSSLLVLSGAEGRRCAVLGDMGELGEEEVLLHDDVGTFAASCVDHLIAIGPLSRAMYDAALREKPGLSASWYESVEDFLAHTGDEIRSGDTILVKASHYMHFEKIVEALMRDSAG